MQEFIFYAIDFEGSRDSGILEYGCVKVSSTKGILSVDTQLCKNKAPIDTQESKCHAIYASMLEKHPDFSVYLPKFLQWRSEAFFCAHNAAFENMLLQTYCPVAFQAYTLDTKPQHQWGPWLDTYFLYKKFFKKNNYTLKDLITEFHLQNILEKIAGKFCPPERKIFHCALYDAIACALLLLNFIRYLSPQSNLVQLLQSSCPKNQEIPLSQNELF